MSAMGKIFGLVMMGILAALALAEVRRYMRAGQTQEELPYPRRRLRRRLTIAALFMAVIALAAFWPKTVLWLQVALLLGLGAGLLGGLWLLWRDLRETSRAVIEQSARLDRQAGEALRQILEHHVNKSPENPPES
jgi:fatty acid desaturase